MFGLQCSTIDILNVKSGAIDARRQSLRQQNVADRPPSCSDIPTDLGTFHGKLLPPSQDGSALEPGSKTMQELRNDALMAQKIETGMIFLEMLGSDDARSYWLSAKFPPAFVERLIAGHPAPAEPEVDEHEKPDRSRAFLPDSRVNLFYCKSGRRRDIVRAAVVQAALAIKEEFGSERAMQMLLREGLADKTIIRVLSAEDRRQRAPSTEIA